MLTRMKIRKNISKFNSFAIANNQSAIKGGMKRFEELRSLYPTMNEDEINQ